MGFEGKRKPVLESIMEHHGLPVSGHPRLSSEHMHDTIVSHIASGHCAHQPWPWIRPKLSSPTEAKNTEDITCNDFVHDADLELEDEVGNKIRVLNKVLHKNPSQSLLLCFLQCNCVRIFHMIVHTAVSIFN
jgi:hypothetical protein